jgi:DNA-binding NarL/FixJ family response regulator
MAFYDIFNGDADGLCALHQLRRLERRDAVLVTGAKREIALLDRVVAASGDSLTVLDLSMHENKAGLLRALDAGARCQYFDHHYPGDIPSHPALEAHIQYAPDVCTSLLVDAYVGGRFRAWAVAAAFGDNLHRVARQAAEPLHLTERQLDLLRELGECLNYNAYGDSVADLHFHPAALFRRLEPFDDPFEFLRKDTAIAMLREGYAADLARARSVAPRIETERGLLVVLPDTAWARRASGSLANELSREAPARAHAVMVTRPGGYSVSVRAPQRAPAGADALCRRFGGSGRPGAAGINLLAAPDLAPFERAFLESFVA